MNVRFAVVRAWAIAATAIVAAAVADIGTEIAGNSGWLGSALHDNQHESVVPAFLIGSAMALSLLAFILVARISARDPLLSRVANLRMRIIDVAFALGGSALCIVAMEGYETRFGGISPFDPRSVVLSHAPALLVAFLIVGTILHVTLQSAIRVAAHASATVSTFFEEFLRRSPAAARPRAEVMRSAFELDVTHVPLGIAAGSRGFRAPPRSIRPRSLVV